MSMVQGIDDNENFKVHLTIWVYDELRLHPMVQGIDDDEAGRVQKVGLLIGYQHQGAPGSSSSKMWCSSSTSSCCTSSRMSVDVAEKNNDEF